MARLIPCLFAALACLATPVRAQVAPLQTSLAFAFQENVSAGTHYWCVFPDAQSRWSVVLYERVPTGHSWPGVRYAWTPLVAAIKPAGSTGYYRTITVPPHTSRYCLLTVYRNGIQQPYRGWQVHPPFGWHVFGIIEPYRTLVAEFPANTYPADIHRFQRMILSNWSRPIGPR